MTDKTVMRHLTEEQRNILRQALWDMTLEPEEFLDIIEGRSSRKWPERGFCVARLLESVNWFKITPIVDPQTLCSLWQDARKHVRMKEIREGMDFASRILH
ncbi:MAG: hypothetical protein C0392_06865 [Syntrophus sp. (in: bacteria)]|nr:hypothetical protein [Syntrophus sp. (in: bacteria)]